MYFVYILQSLVDDSYYKGFSENPMHRLVQHNNRESSYTSAKAPWKIVYVERMASKAEALKREKNLKKATNERVKALISHPKNIAAEFAGKDSSGS